MNRERWQQIDQLFRRALEQAEDTIESFLTTACGADLELREAVGSLLDIDKQSFAMLDRPSSGSVAKALPGESIGPWILGSPIGEGSSGVVFEARRIGRPSDHPVAIKCLHNHLVGSKARARFLLEAQVLARLDHPHIARLVDTGVSDGGIPYMVLERVTGTRLDVWVRDTLPPLEQRLLLFQQICSAVAKAHRNQVIHRDLKPGNILVTAEGQPKVVDFGIARVLPGGGDEISRLTLAHQQPMTPQYASPEQLRGSDVTPASDVYSLGLVLYELLTGRLPYQLSHVFGDELHRLLAGELLIQTPSLIARRAAPGSLMPWELHPDLDTIALTTLQTDLDRRYPTAQVLFEKIARFRSGL